jgi:putative transposase
MPDYRRLFSPGGTFFFTVVTWQRKPIFAEPQARVLLGEAFRQTADRYPFQTNAICLLPDHLHCIWTLPEDETDYSIRWRFLKAYLSRNISPASGMRSELSASRVKRREASIWQRRFWEHRIRDEEDFQRHLDYIHFNPVKHDLVQNVGDWPWSSFRRYVGLGWYPAVWGCRAPFEIQNTGEEWEG